MSKQPCVYILANKPAGTLYVGVTSHLPKRIWEHKNKVVLGFTEKYAVHLLVWYEVYSTMVDAIETEKRIKKWNRSWKISLIEKTNTDWRDLYEDL